jgi:uncharacterized protein (DUF1810 family)
MPDVSSTELTHDRYLVYKILGRKISFTQYRRGCAKKVNGIVQRVCRDIFDNMIEISVGGRMFRFKEPDVIAYAPGNKDVILFVYGKVSDESDMSDNALFAEVRASFFKGENINDVISRTTPNRTKIQKFFLLPS